MSQFDIAKLFPAAPQFDVKPLIAAQQKNFEAVVKANTLLSEGFQTFLKRQAELFQANLTTSLSAAKGGFGAGKDLDLKDSYTLIQTLTSKAASDSRELIDIVTSASAKAFEVLRHRGDEATAELKGLFPGAR